MVNLIRRMAWRHYIPMAACLNTIYMGTNNELEKVLTTGEVARLVAVCKATILRWLRARLIEAPQFVRIGRMPMWSKRDYERALSPDSILQMDSVADQ